MTIRDLIPWTRMDTQLGSEGVDNPVLVAMNGVFPRTDVAETDEEVEVSIELPGIDEKDIDVAIANDVLTIRGEKKNGREEKRKGFYMSERSYGAFAEFKQGILTISLPKTPEARSKVKKIEVKAA
jgi:HSP20 family protein